MTRFAHALIVGGSGMLAGCCRKVLRISDRVSVLGRDEVRIRAIAPDIQPVVCDYSDAMALARVLDGIGAPDLVIAWIHGPAPKIRRMVARCVHDGGRFVQVLGSRHGDSAHPERLAAMARAAQGLPLVYQAVILGFVLREGVARWLTDGEISDGVFAAVQSAAPLAIIGTAEPASAQPAMP
jgi:hypothetical protein